MYIRPNNNKPRRCPAGKSQFGNLVSLVVFVIIAINIIHFVLSPGRPSRSGPVAVSSQPQEVARNPIMRQLEESGRANPDKREGIAIAVVFDVSGSMTGTVPAGENRQIAKIDSARQCALGLLGKIDAFIASHPEKPIQTAIMEFSTRKGQPPCRVVIPFGALDLAAAGEAIVGMRADGGTPIGDALLFARRELELTGLSQQHILLITDGSNTTGYAPVDVMNGFSRLPSGQAPSVYFIAFDTGAEQFAGINEEGGLLLSAANDSELQTAIDYVLTGKILAEQPGAQGN